MANLKIGQTIRDYEVNGEEGVVENIENDGTVVIRWTDNNILEEFESEWILLMLTSNEHLIGE